mgnify:CR=1 FL=1
MIGETGTSGTCQQGTRKTTCSDKHCVIADFWSHSIPQHRGGKLQLSTTHQLTFFLSIFSWKDKRETSILTSLFVCFLFHTFPFRNVAAEMISAVLDEMLLKGENCVIKLRHNATRDY